MKKILSLMLSLMVLASAVMPVSAFSEDNIEITTNVSKIIVTVSAPCGGTMTAQVVNMAENVLYGMDEISTPVLSGSDYVYTFNFKMQYNVPTDTYKVVVGGNVPQKSKEFPYVNINDKITFYENLDTTASDDIKLYFQNNPAFVPVDLTEYNNLSGDVLGLVNDKISDLSLNPEIVPADTEAQKNIKVMAKDSLFQSAFATLMNTARVADADEAEFAECIADTTFSDYFYKNENMAEAALSATEVYPYYKKEAQKVTSLELVNYIKAFNDATLLTVEKTRGFGVLKTAFLYSEANSLLVPAPDMTNINMLVTAGKDADLWKDLLKAENDDVEALVANAETIAKTMVDNGVLTDTPLSPGAGLGGSSFGGGGSGGGGSGGSVDKPTTPGVSTGIINKQEETEASKTFSDLSQAEWAREAVESLASGGVINGKTPAEFAPIDAMTREEFVKVIIGAFNLLNSAAKCDFSDVESSRWSYSYIASANRIGLVTGDGEKFNPTATISRQDMAVIIYRLLELAGVEVFGESVNFTDGSEISSYARKAVETLSAAGIINGMGDGTFSPKTPVTRAQAAKVIYELQKIVGGEN